MQNYIIETDQLGLRELTMNDLQDWYQILSDEETMQFYPNAYDLDKTRGWIDWNLGNYRKYGFGLWAIILKETDQFIGDSGITMQNIYGDGNLLPETGYHINKHFWRKGYASQAAKACLKYHLRIWLSMKYFLIKSGQMFLQEKLLKRLGCHCARSMLTRKIRKQAYTPLLERNFMRNLKI